MPFCLLDRGSLLLICLGHRRKPSPQSTIVVDHQSSSTYYLDYRNWNLTGRNVLKNWPFYPRSKSNQQMFNHVIRNVHHVLLPSPFSVCAQFLNSNVKSKVKLLFPSFDFISSEFKPSLVFDIIYISPLASVYCKSFCILLHSSKPQDMYLLVPYCRLFLGPTRWKLIVRYCALCTSSVV